MSDFLAPAPQSSRLSNEELRAREIERWNKERGARGRRPLTEYEFELRREASLAYRDSQDPEERRRAFDLMQSQDMAVEEHARVTAATAEHRRCIAEALSRRKSTGSEVSESALLTNPSATEAESVAALEADAPRSAARPAAEPLPVSYPDDDIPF